MLNYYVSNTKHQQSTKCNVEVEKKTGDIGIHLDGMYLSMPKTSWKTIAKAVNKAIKVEKEAS